MSSLGFEVGLVRFCRSDSEFRQFIASDIRLCRWMFCGVYEWSFFARFGSDKQLMKASDGFVGFRWLESIGGNVQDPDVNHRAVSGLLCTTTSKLTLNPKPQTLNP